MKIKSDAHNQSKSADVNSKTEASCGGQDNWERLKRRRLILLRGVVDTGRSKIDHTF